MALCEFGCPSLEYVYDMSWAEFRIRQFAYNRRQKEELFRVREIAYASLVGPHLQKVPTKEQYMPLEGKKSVTETMKERMRKAVLEYKKQKDAKS